VTLRLGLRVTRRIYRDGLASSLDGMKEFTVVCASASANDLLRLAQIHEMDCVVVEADTVVSAAASIAALRQAHPSLRVVVLHDGQRAELHRLYRVGASAAADRRDGIEGIVAAITDRRVDTPRCLDREPAPRRHADADVTPLTRREREVLELVAVGLTSRAISTQLAVSPKTIENHKQRIFHKLRVQNQGHAVAVALRTGLIAAVPNDVIDLRSSQSLRASSVSSQDVIDLRDTTVRADSAASFVDSVLAAAM
jgi:DNA-binding NarL/FixJ family response regulator